MIVHIEYQDTVDGQIVLGSRIVGGSPAYTYSWEMQSYNQNAALDILVTSAANTDTISLGRESNQYENTGMISLTVTDSLGAKARGFFQVKFSGA